MGVSKFLQLRFPQLWGPIILRADLWLGWGLKKRCSTHQGIFNGISHATYMWGNRGDFRLLVVGSQTANLTLDLYFSHNLCFRCPNGSSKPILNIYVPKYFQWYKEPQSNAFWPLQSVSKNSEVHLGFQSPKWEFAWECEGSFSHTLLHSQEHEMWFPGFPLNLHPCIGYEPKAKVATFSLWYINPSSFKI
jgi:hypothetical protein